MKIKPLEDSGPPRVDPIAGLVRPNRTATPFCEKCAKPIDWKFEGSSMCGECRESAE
jgi:hypothetical protein